MIFNIDVQNRHPHNFGYMEVPVSKKHKIQRSDAVGKWEFTLDRDQVRASMRDVLKTAQERTKEIRETHQKGVAAA